MIINVYKGPDGLTVPGPPGSYAAQPGNLFPHNQPKPTFRCGERFWLLARREEGVSPQRAITDAATTPAAKRSTAQKGTKQHRTEPSIAVPKSAVQCQAVCGHTILSLD